MARISIYCYVCPRTTVKNKKLTRQFRFDGSIGLVAAGIMDELLLFCIFVWLLISASFRWRMRTVFVIDVKSLKKSFSPGDGAKNKAAIIICN